MKEIQFSGDGVFESDGRILIVYIPAGIEDKGNLLHAYGKCFNFPGANVESKEEEPKNEPKKRRAPEELVAKARRIGSRGDFESAAECFAQLLVSYPDDEDLRFLYAASLFELGRYREALPHFEAVVEVQPLNEWASLGIAHCLWKAGSIREAMDELKRFHRAGGVSMEHRRLVREIIQSGSLFLSVQDDR